MKLCLSIYVFPAMLWQCPPWLVASEGSATFGVSAGAEEGALPPPMTRLEFPIGNGILLVHKFHNACWVFLSTSVRAQHRQLLSETHSWRKKKRISLHVSLSLPSTQGFKMGLSEPVPCHFLPRKVQQSSEFLQALKEWERRSRAPWNREA